MSRFISVTSSAIDFRQLRKSKAQQSSPLKRIPSSKRGNNILWQVWQNGQTAIEQPAQTQVEQVYKCLSGRRGREASPSIHTHKSKSKERNFDTCGPRENSDLANDSFIHNCGF